MSVIIMSILSGLFRSRDKPTNSTNGSAYRFLFGGSNSGKAANLQAVMLGSTVHIGRAFDLDEIARLIGAEIGKQIYLPC